MNKFLLFTFRLKCFLSIPFYLVFLVNNKDKKLSYELREWGENVPINYYKNEFFAFIRLFAAYKEYRSLFLYRIGNFGTILSIVVPHMDSCHFITSSKDIGYGLVLQHGYSTIIWPIKMGNNCQIWHNVTIGRAHDKGSRPTIGNNVKICTGAIVIGDIVIGDNCIIAAGSVVVKSVPANCVVCGNPARIVKQNGIKVNIQI